MQHLPLQKTFLIESGKQKNMGNPDRPFPASEAIPVEVVNYRQKETGPANATLTPKFIIA